MSSSESETESSSSPSSESDSDIDIKSKKTRKKKITLKSSNPDVGLDLTSSLNKHYICDGCGHVYKMKGALFTHLVKKRCSQFIKKKVVCHWCNTEFTNKGNLAHHARYMHGETSEKVKKMLLEGSTYTCNICKDRTFKQKWSLTYHIRKEHMNLKARVPYAEVKKVNQVWFEKVMNTESVIEIKKAGVNTLIMRPLDEKSKIVINNDNDYARTIDLTHIYPTEKSIPRTECKHCHKVYNSRDLKKHIEEVHLNLKRYSCNNCNRTFKRTYHYVQHVCGKARRVKGVKNQSNEGIMIASVESLSIPLGL